MIATDFADHVTENRKTGNHTQRGNFSRAANGRACQRQHEGECSRGNGCGVAPD
jgi:hypothetical protein